MRSNPVTLLALGTALALALELAGCGSSESPEPHAGATEKHADAAGKHADADAAKKKPAAHGKEAEEHEGALRLSEAEVKQAGIVVETLQPQKVADQLVLTANIAANQDRIAHVAPRIDGRVIKVTASLGDRVKTGQPLAVIDSIQMGEAHAEYRRAQSELRLAEAAFQRADGLFKEQVVPRRQWLEAKSADERAQASAAAATEKLRMLGHSPDNWGSNFVVTAPFAGVVIEKKAVLGELAKPENSMFTIADLSTVWIQADVVEKDLEKLAVGAPATVTVSAFPDDVFKGRVSYIASVIDRETRTVKARIEVLNLNGKLRLDMYAKAAIGHTGTREALVLPQDAVVIVQGRPVVYVPTDNGFEPRPVEVGERLRGRIVIASGLKAGEKVVTAGAYALKSRQLKSQISDVH
ncbi:MAG: efflux RND transporter periplasmic adaptor subunit [Betaproteobacteria bacterium]|nr:efflux RND transporter periplasmic adaptor subunit [Betaproteobacteria bacterium]